MAPQRRRSTKLRHGSWPSKWKEHQKLLKNKIYANDTWNASFKCTSLKTKQKQTYLISDWLGRLPVKLWSDFGLNESNYPGFNLSSTEIFLLGLKRRPGVVTRTGSARRQGMKSLLFCFFYEADNNAVLHYQLVPLRPDIFFFPLLNECITGNVVLAPTQLALAIVTCFIKTFNLL